MSSDQKIVTEFIEIVTKNDQLVFRNLSYTHESKTSDLIMYPVYSESTKRFYTLKLSDDIMPVKGTIVSANLVIEPDDGKKQFLKRLN